MVSRQVTTVASRAAGPSRRALFLGAGAGAGTLLLAACTSPAAGGPAAVATANPGTGAAMLDFPIDPSSWPKGKKVGLLAPPPQYDIDKRMIDAATELAKAAGWEVSVVDVTQSDPNAAARGWATQGFDAALSLFIPATYFASGAQALRDAGIPLGGVIAGYTEQLDFDVQANEWASAGEIVAWGLNRLGGVSPGPGGAKGKVAILGVPGAVHQDIRIRVLKSMVDFCPGVEIVAEPGLNAADLVGDSKTKTAALLSRYPKGELDWIFTADSTLGVAAAQAIEAAGRDDVFVTGCNGVLQEFDGIRSGGPNVAATYVSVEYATQVAMQTLANMVGGGKALAPTLYIDAPMITSDNVPAQGEFPPIQVGLSLASAIS